MTPDVTKVLVITRNFPPLLGGMERLNLNLVKELYKRFDVRLVSIEGAQDYTPDGLLVYPVISRPLSSFLLSACWKSISVSKEWRPDVIVAGSGLVAPLAVIASWFSGARVVTYVHGLDITYDQFLYRSLWRLMIKKSDVLVANSNPTARLAKEYLGISEGDAAVVSPGVTLPDPCNFLSVSDRQVARIDLCNKYNLNAGPILLSVGRLAKRKGLLEFVVEVLPEVVRNYPDVNFLIIGDAPTDSLNASIQTKESIQTAADFAGVGHVLRFLGRVSDDELNLAFQLSDVHVFPVRDLVNDPEGFGMVAIEAAAYGLPTVAYSTGGVVDAVKDGVSGFLVEPGDSREFKNALIKTLCSPLDTENIRRYALDFSWDKFGENFSIAVAEAS